MRYNIYWILNEFLIVILISIELVWNIHIDVFIIARIQQNIGDGIMEALGDNKITIKRFR